MMSHAVGKGLFLFACGEISQGGKVFGGMGKGENNLDGEGERK
jgi:hypothetical protein